MSLLDTDLGQGRRWTRVGDGYAVTKKPRSLDRSAFPAIPFAAMEAIPQGGDYLPGFTMKSPEAIASGTYFERGNILISKITPSFENGKQALIQELAAPFGYATTEVIPLYALSDQHDPRFLFFYLLHPDIRHHVAERMEGSTGRQRVPENVLLDLPIPDFALDEQTAIAVALEVIQRAASAEANCGEMGQKLKRAATRALFTKGVRGEAQKETEIGPVPESWAVGRLDRYANVVSTRMSYSELETLQPAEDGEAVRVLGIKVADMNLPGNEVEFTAAILEKRVPRAIAEYRCAPPRTIIFPKRGAAIATNKKRISNEWTAFDPNVIGVIGGNDLDQDFLFHWFQTFDLRTITEPGPTPQLNKKNLEPLIIPVPPTLDEQREIVAVLNAVDRKIDLHRRKRAVLDELLKALLHKLMTGQIHVVDLDLSALDAQPVTELAA
ncbi:MAG: restriction endonuclease subunit S [Pseudomonadota bacterium]|nr:restriction endonuclease subunit S [Pseudomonadota bacterium]